MKAIDSAIGSALEPHIVEQALVWVVTLQSGTCHAHERDACQVWRALDPRHELAWQRLNGFGQSLREGTGALPPSGARRLLQTRAMASRRTLLKGFAGLGVVAATGWSVHDRLLMPQWFADLHTGTGERRRIELAHGGAMQLDTQTALDDRGDTLHLLRGRILLELRDGPVQPLTTPLAWVSPQAGARLVVSHGETGTLVQVLAGTASLGGVHSGWRARALKAGVQPPRTSGQANPTWLKGGQQLLVTAPSLDTPGALASYPDAWARGLLIAERMPLGALVTELDRYRPGVLRCDKHVAALQVTGSFSLDQPDASLELLVRTLPIRIHHLLGYWTTVQSA